MKKLKTNEITNGIDTNVLKSSCWASLTIHILQILDLKLS